MALTLEEEQKLEGVKLDVYLTANEAAWLATLRQAHAFLKGALPPGTVIRHDDVAKTLLAIAEVDEALQAEFAAKNLKPKYWFRYFTNLVIDRLWAQI